MNYDKCNHWLQNMVPTLKKKTNKIQLFCLDFDEYG